MDRDRDRDGGRGGPVRPARQGIEPFSGNALYYPRGMGRMDGYKTVKEVCALTGLTGKHLYYFHHARVVRAVAFANYSVEGNDGYKLYDDAGVEKLQHIALYYQLGLKRNEIRDIMLAPDYDMDRTLDTLLCRKRAERARIERQLAAMEHLKRVGAREGLAELLATGSVEELGQRWLAQQEERAAAASDGGGPEDRDDRVMKKEEDR